MKIPTIIGVMLLAIIIAGIITANVINSSKQDQLRNSVKKLKEYCLVVHVSMDMDARDFASGDPKRQEQALERFGNPVTYHSEQEMMLCSNVMPNLDNWSKCFVSKDYKCLERLARAATEATKQ